MRILIVGLGYAGQRYWRAFDNLAKKMGFDLEIAYVGRKRRDNSLLYFNSVSSAISSFQPEITIISVNDNSHIEILERLKNYTGFIICEKPLAVPGDEWQCVCNNLKKIKGFALDLVERYSEATKILREKIQKEKWVLVRGNFYWGKDRLNDYRPTCGVTSEVIHALDLISWICSSQDTVKLENVLGVRSDFSISGANVLDTILLTAQLGDASVTGYSSFVNIQRQRNVDFSFVDLSGCIIHSRIIYDTPQWDHDHLKIWTRDKNGKEIIIAEHVVEKNKSGLKTLYKLSVFCEEVLRFVAFDTPPSQPFADLSTAMSLQTLLDEINQKTEITASVRYIYNTDRLLISEDADLESLG
ncbi:TPA: Gfo/Idh/MocA family oxidoreductase [Enterobacter hormaechei subsp. steigerwaltii]|nr:Gfo/Idh/MocA family oxidoreductase [Enterobacter hormaechei subsp. steigerwaltii]